MPTLIPRRFAGFLLLSLGLLAAACFADDPGFGPHVLMDGKFPRKDRRVQGFRQNLEVLEVHQAEVLKMVEAFRACGDDECAERKAVAAATTLRDYIAQLKDQVFPGSRLAKQLARGHPKAESLTRWLDGDQRTVQAIAERGRAYQALAEDLGREAGRRSGETRVVLLQKYVEGLGLAAMERANAVRHVSRELGMLVEMMQ